MDPDVRVNASGSCLGSDGRPLFQRPAASFGLLCHACPPRCAARASASGLPSAPPLRSTGSAGPCGPLFASFDATMSESDSSFALRPRHCVRGGLETSQVPAMRFCPCHGSSTPGCPPSPHRSGWEMLPSTVRRVSAHPTQIIFGAHWPGPDIPLPTLHLTPRGDRRTARGGSGG